MSFRIGNVKRSKGRVIKVYLDGGCLRTYASWNGGDNYVEKCHKEIRE